MSLRKLGLGAAALGVLAGAAPAALAAQPQPGGRALGVDVSNFDTSVRPQDDFYRFVNGAWLRNTQIPADRSSYGTFVQLRERSEAALKQIIDEVAATPNHRPGSDLQKVADFYLSFMDTAHIEQLGTTPVRAAIETIAALTSRDELPGLFASLRRLGVQTPFSFGVGQDAKDATRYVVYVGQSGLGLPDRDYYLREGERFDQQRAAYVTYVETLLRLGGQPDPAGSARAIFELEKKLAARHWDRARSRDREASYNPRTVAELEAMTPGFSWTRFLLAASAEETPAVIVRQPDYLAALDSVLTATPVPVLRQYLSFKLLDAYSQLLTRDFVNANFAFYGRALQGLPELRPRWKRGVSAAEGALGEVLGRMYVERNFRPEAKARMQQLVDNLLQAFREGIDELEWMSPETKAQAKDKLAHLNVKIGYPDRWRDYSALEVRRGDAVGNAMRASRFGYEYMISRLGGPINREEWGMTPQTVNAYYNASLNEIVFPAAILQPPFFNVEADDAVNYGGIGAVIGHEISHGFDDQGRRSDGLGNLRDWWAASDASAFEQRANMLVEQYGAYTPVPGTPVNGRLTLGENIGDVSGLAVAYRAYKRSLNGREAPVIGGYTGDQRFFLGWAQIWRSMAREDALRQLLLTDTHSPGEFRTNGVLVNMPEFYAAFNVKPGDRMYLPPEKRVKIW